MIDDPNTAYPVPILAIFTPKEINRGRKKYMNIEAYLLKLQLIKDFSYYFLN